LLSKWCSEWLESHLQALRVARRPTPSLRGVVAIKF